MPATRSNRNMLFFHHHSRWPVEAILGKRGPQLAVTSIVLRRNTCSWTFHSSHSRDHTGSYIVLLPMKTDVTPLRESRSLAVRRFKALNRSLRGLLCWHWPLLRVFQQEMKTVCFCNQTAPQEPQPGHPNGDNTQSKNNNKRHVHFWKQHPTSLIHHTIMHFIYCNDIIYVPQL